MNASTAFKNRKEQLADALKRAGSVQEAVSACTMALEQVACELAQSEQDEQARQRQQAVLAALRAAPQLLFAAEAEGELVLAAGGAQKTEKPDKKRRAALAAGAFLLGSLAVYEMIDGQMLFGALQLIGCALAASGLKKDGGAAGVQARGIAKINAGEVIRRMAALCRAADICTGDLAMLDSAADAARLSGTADEAMLDLLCALMEAKASGRDEKAMRSLSQAEQYLHMLGIDVVFYSGENAALFDVLPTIGEARTIRPALVRDGAVLRRGTAACCAGEAKGGAAL